MQQTARTDLLFELHPELFNSLGRANLVQQIQVYYLQNRTHHTATSIHMQTLVNPSYLGLTCMGSYLMHKHMLAYSSSIFSTLLPLESDTHTPDQLPVRWHTQGRHAYAHNQTSRQTSRLYPSQVRWGRALHVGRTYAVLKLLQAFNLCWLAVMQSSGQLPKANAGQSMHA